MKKLVISIVALMTAAVSYGQETIKPTDWKDNYVDGIVLAVKYEKYEYKENFGEPTTGQLLEARTTFFNEDGRSIILRRSAFGRTFYHLYSDIFDYTSDGENNKVTTQGVFASIDLAHYTNDCTPLMTAATSGYEDFMFNAKQYSSNYSCMPSGDVRIYTYDPNGVLILNDVYAQNYPQPKLMAKAVARSQGNGVYQVNVYRGSGDNYNMSMRTYKNGLLVKKTSEGANMYSAPQLAGIEIPLDGEWKYNNKGQLLSFTKFLKGYNEITEYIHNNHGVVEKTKFTGYGNAFDFRDFYRDYKYDSHGNWIYRTFAPGNGKVVKWIEKREIVYCETKDELKEKSAAMYAAVKPLVMSAQKMK